MPSGFFGGVGIGPYPIGRSNRRWWEVAGQICVAAYQPIGAADLATSYVNLANPGTYDAVPGTAPTFATATGWTFAAASSQSLTTGITPGAAFNPATYSVVIRVASAVANTNALGAWNASQIGLRVLPVRSNNTDSIFNNGNQLIVSGGATANGVLAVAGNAAYINGVVQVGTMVTSGQSVDVPIAIGALNFNGALSYFDGVIAAVAIYSSILFAADVAALTNRMAALT